MSRELYWTVILVFTVLTNIAMGTHTRAQQKIMVGWVENVYLPEQGCMIRAKIDTGAKNSSIHALDVEYVEDEGRSPGTRVRFKTFDKEKKPQVIEADVVSELDAAVEFARTSPLPEPESALQDLWA